MSPPGSRVSSGEAAHCIKATDVFEWAGLRSGDGPLSVRGAPPPSRAPEDHFKPLRRNDLQYPPLSVGASAPLRSETKGKAGACPDRARAPSFPVRCGLSRVSTDC